MNGIIKQRENGHWGFFVNGKMMASSGKSQEKLIETVKKKFGDVNFINTDSVEMEIPKSEFSVAERFDFISEFVRLVARGVIPSLVVTGSGGLGKTHTIIETLKAAGKIELGIGDADGDFVMMKGYATPRGLYEALYDYNGKIIVFDDCDSVHKDAIAANLMKAALDSNGKRVISWGSSSSKDDTYPTRFEFIGKVIFISNLSLDKFPQALLSRSMLADITLNTEEKIERIAQVFESETAHEMDDKIEVIEFIRKNATKFKDLNIRSAFNALKMKVAIGDNWERMALYSATLN